MAAKKAEKPAAKPAKAEKKAEKPAKKAVKKAAPEKKPAAPVKPTKTKTPKPNPKGGLTSENAAAVTATGTLAKRLQIKPGNSVLILRAPEGFEGKLEPLPEKVELKKQLRSTYDVLIVFVQNKAEIDAYAEKAIAGVKKGGVLWFCYPKSTGSIKTDINRDKGWDAIMNAGYQPVTQIKIDDTWSALRYRPASEVGT